MQEDAVLLIPKCSPIEIDRCGDPLSKHLVMKTTEEEGIVVTDQRICSVAVPGGCPRIQCLKSDPKTKESKYMPCRMLAFIQSQENESGFWMKLPCSMCPEERKLHPLTEGFVYGG